jgi:hypothetical protein
MAAMKSAQTSRVDAALASLLKVRADRAGDGLITSAMEVGLQFDEATVLIHHHVHGRSAIEIMAMRPDLFASAEQVYCIAHRLLESLTRLHSAQG